MTVTIRHDTLKLSCHDHGARVFNVALSRAHTIAHTGMTSQQSQGSGALHFIPRQTVGGPLCFAAHTACCPGQWNRDQCDSPSVAVPRDARP